MLLVRLADGFVRRVERLDLQRGVPLGDIRPDGRESGIGFVGGEGVGLSGVVGDRESIRLSAGYGRNIKDRRVNEPLGMHIPEGHLAWHAGTDRDRRVIGRGGAGGLKARCAKVRQAAMNVVAQCFTEEFLA